MPEQATTCRYFTSYSGVKLPLKLVGELDDGDMSNRNTYFRGSFDDAGQLIVCEKLVYGETEFRHEYRYHPDGRIAHATIDDGSHEPTIIDYPA